MHRGRGTAIAAAQKSPGRLRNELRIVAGEWRGRKIRFEPTPQVRPTPDRVRETLFNWLQTTVAGTRCLDLFAGSGALGLEALSRGAAAAVFVEHNRGIAAGIGRMLATFGARAERRAQVVCADAFEFLGGAPSRFELVFLDPPFAQGRLSELCTLLETRGWLAPRAAIYLESAARSEPPVLPARWQLTRRTRAGEVSGQLIRREAVDQT